VGADGGASHVDGAVCGGCGGGSRRDRQRRWRGHNRHRGDEPIPLPMHGRNVLWCPGHISEHMANFTDTGGERPVADMHVRPDGRQEVRTVEPGYAEEKEHEPTCTLKTLKGRYLFGGIATLLPPAVEQQSLLAVAGYHTFNGDGTGTDIVTVTINGAVVLENFVAPISYTVNPDCSGTYTVPISEETFGLFIAPHGEELMVIGTTPGSILVQGPNRRVSRK
jgi:hypothetical protein